MTREIIDLAFISGLKRRGLISDIRMVQEVGKCTMASGKI
jgi:hypothetical protein